MRMRGSGFGCGAGEKSKNGVFLGGEKFTVKTETFAENSWCKDQVSHGEKRKEKENMIVSWRKKSCVAKIGRYELGIYKSGFTTRRRLRGCMHLLFSSTKLKE